MTGTARHHDLVVIGASAGGVEAIIRVVATLPPDLDAAVVVVVHVSSDTPSALPAILSRKGTLPAAHVVDGERLQAGRVYIAPPDRHVVVNPGHLALSRGPRENGHRPSIDPLFRSAARFYADRVVGVILSGVLDDGSDGLRQIKDAGGCAIVQDPEDALYPAMPANAIAATDVDHVVPSDTIGEVVAKIVPEPARGRTMSDDMTDLEVASAQLDPEAIARAEELEASHYSCPDCHGVLSVITEGGVLRFRCRVGHAWSPETLLAAQTAGLEAALWMALRALEEKASLSRRLADNANERRAPLSYHRFDEAAADAEYGAAMLRKLLAETGLTDGAAASPSGDP